MCVLVRMCFRYERARKESERKSTLRSSEAAGNEAGLSIMVGLNIEVVTPDSSTILDFPVYLR